MRIARRATDIRWRPVNWPSPNFREPFVDRRSDVAVVAYFHAYQTIVTGAYLRARMLAEGVPDAGSVLNEEAGRNLLKAALPHHGELIDRSKQGAFHYFLDELRERLLSELRTMLEGKDADRAAIDKAKRITDLIGETETKQVEQRIAAAKAEAGLVKE